MISDDRVPEYLRKRLNEVYSEQEQNSIIKGYTAKRRTAFRVNTLKADAISVTKALSEKGIDLEALQWFENGFTCLSEQEELLKETEEYNLGMIYVQNPSSMLPPVLLGNCEGLDVLDMCAAPGGKTTQIAAMNNGKCGIMACEQDKVRAEKLKYNLVKQGARATVQVADARRLDSFFRFDKILLDAPCSGSGVITLDKRNTYKAFSEQLVKNCAKLQLQLLNKAFSMLKPGGELVYSTCSILPEENEQNVKMFVDATGAEPMPLDEQLTSVPTLTCRQENGLLVCPTEVYEGFFAIKFTKR